MIHVHALILYFAPDWKSNLFYCIYLKSVNGFLLYLSKVCLLGQFSIWFVLLSKIIISEKKFVLINNLDWDIPIKLIDVGYNNLFTHLCLRFTSNLSWYKKGGNKKPLGYALLSFCVYIFNQSYQIQSILSMVNSPFTFRHDVIFLWGGGGGVGSLLWLFCESF